MKQWAHHLQAGLNQMEHQRPTSNRRGAYSPGVCASTGNRKPCQVPLLPLPPV